MKIVNIIAIAFVLCLFVIGCEKTSTPITKEDSKTENNKADTEIKEDSIISKVSAWDYGEEIDKMGDKIFYAQNICPEDLKLSFPYENSYAKILIRNIEGKNDVLFMVSKGQIKGYVYEGGNARIRFDDEKPFLIGYNGASDGSSEVIFLQNSKKLIDKLKNSKRMVIEVEFYDNGTRQIEFNTSGFEWEH